MTLFFICAALLVLLSLAWLLVGLFRAQDSSTDQEAVNITLARERRETLETALADGAIDQATFDYEREQLEYDLAADLQLESKAKTRKGGQVAAAVLVTVFVPVAAGALYLHLGNPAALTQERNTPITSTDNTGNTAQTAPALADMLPQMEERLAQQPEDIDGWRLLGRSYLSIGDFGKAQSAFEKALALDETDVPTLAQLAESIAMTQQGDLSGEPLKYVTRANELDPDNEHALWLLSIARQQSGDHQSAMQGFDKLAGLAQGNPEALATINDMKARSVDALSGLQSPDQPSESTDATSTTAAATSDIADSDSNPSITVTVNVSEQARAASTEDQVVFVYATATQGPPMPLAVSRIKVSDLPATVTLDNSMAMIPTMTLSAFPSVTIGARISTTGNAIAQPGDWFSEAGDIAPATASDVELTIDQQTP
ncbi:MAG: c-type cytochrome biogenesis protein CcmI [Granulosicoccus sp.]